MCFIEKVLMIGFECIVLAADKTKPPLANRPTGVSVCERNEVFRERL